MPHIDPDREAWELFKGLPRDRPIHMLNLITLKTRAEYPEGHPGHGKDISGADAYRAYGRGIAPVFERLGARQVWAGRPQVMVTLDVIADVYKKLRKLQDQQVENRLAAAGTRQPLRR